MRPRPIASLWALLSVAGPAAGQQGVYRDPATRDLVHLAREHRASARTAPDSVGYSARAEGHVYFFLERDDGGAPIPMRVDQVALDIHRSRRGETRQIVRGLRRRELLPVKDFRYYIDRLTAVQDGFGDRINVGQGHDVRGVLHPLAEGGEETYRYRIADSIRVSGPDAAEPLLVYRVEVEPRRDDAPAFVGSVFLEAATGALARMDFTFTPSSYVDRRNSGVHVRLEHALWEGRHWLPHRQTIEVRREIPELELPVASVIRATLRIGGYDFAPTRAEDFFDQSAPTLVAYGEADSSEFQAGLMAGMADQGLAPMGLAEVRAEARRVTRERVASGLPKARFYADRLSSLIRANRAEGVYAGAGASFSPQPAVKLEWLAGYGFWSRAAATAVRGRWTSDGGARARVELHWNQLRDVGTRRFAAEGVNTLHALLRGYDYTDPYFASGARAEIGRSVGGGGARVDLRLGWEDYDAPGAPWRGGLGDGSANRPLRPVEEGTRLAVGAGATKVWSTGPNWSVSAALGATGSRWRGSGGLAATARVDFRVAARDLSRRAFVGAEAGSAEGSQPSQHHYFLGGRGTLPGHPYRAYGGRRFALARAELSVSMAPTWLSARILAGAGAVGGEAASLLEGWDAAPTRGLVGYAGIGLATVHDAIRVDGHWGLPGGEFELVVSVDPRLAELL